MTNRIPGHADVTDTVQIGQGPRLEFIKAFYRPWVDPDTGEANHTILMLCMPDHPEMCAIKTGHITGTLRRPWEVLWMRCEAPSAREARSSRSYQKALVERAEAGFGREPHIENPLPLMNAHDRLRVAAWRDQTRQRIKVFFRDAAEARERVARLA